jgi:hypothetical protein
MFILTLIRFGTHNSLCGLLCISRDGNVAESFCLFSGKRKFLDENKVENDNAFSEVTEVEFPFVTGPTSLFYYLIL